MKIGPYKFDRLEFAGSLGIGLATTNMGIAFLIGILVQGLIKWRDIDI